MEQKGEPIMAIKYNVRTSAALFGAWQVNSVHRVLAQEDVGAKLERLISALSVLQSAVSAINALQTAVCAINNGLGSAAASLAGASLFSAWSGFGSTASAAGQTCAAITAWSSLSNFRVSWNG